jgi:hypothetical protein
MDASEKDLINLIGSLPSHDAEKILIWERQLADLADKRTIEWSDAWTDEDLAEATATAVRRFDEFE